MVTSAASVSVATSSSSDMTDAPVSISRAPVGSSARIRTGLRTRALAMATRCCSPPESLSAIWSTRCPRPTRSSMSAAIWRRFQNIRPFACPSGIITLSIAVRPGRRLNCWNTKPTLSPRRRSRRPERIRRHLPTFERDGAGGGRIQHPQDVEQRRFPRPRAAHDGDVVPAPTSRVTPRRISRRESSASRTLLETSSSATRLTSWSRCRTAPLPGRPHSRTPRPARRSRARTDGCCRPPPGPPSPRP